MIHLPDYGEIMGELKIGSPFHGLWKSPGLILQPGTLTTATGDIPYKDIWQYPNPKRADLGCTAFLTRVPGMDPVDPPTNGEAKLRMEWRNYALSCGAASYTDGVPLTTITSYNPQFPGSFLYIDGNKNIWQINASIAWTPATNTFYVTRFGYLDETTHSYTSVTATYSGDKGTTPYGAGHLGLVAKDSTGSETIWGRSNADFLGDFATIYDPAADGSGSTDPVMYQYTQAWPLAFFKVTITGNGDETLPDYGLSIHIEFLEDKVTTTTTTTTGSSYFDVPFYRIESTGYGSPLRHVSASVAYRAVYSNSSALIWDAVEAGKYNASGTRTIDKTSHLWCMYDDNDVLQWVTSKQLVIQQATVVCSSVEPVVNDGTCAGTPSGGSYFYQVGDISGGTITFPAATSTCNWSRTWRAQRLLNGVAFLDTGPVTKTGTDYKEWPAVVYSMWTSLGLNSPDNVLDQSTGHTSEGGTDTTFVGTTSSSVWSGGWGNLLHCGPNFLGDDPEKHTDGWGTLRLACNMIAFFPVTGMAYEDSPTTARRNPKTMGRILGVVTPDGWTAVDFQAPRMPWKLPEPGGDALRQPGASPYTTDVGVGIFGSYQPITKQIALDTAPVCFI